MRGSHGAQVTPSFERPDAEVPPSFLAEPADPAPEGPGERKPGGARVRARRRVCVFLCFRAREPAPHLCLCACVRAGVGPNVAQTADGDPLAVGGFVYMRNARFDPSAESTIAPRYWVARVTAIKVRAPRPCRRPPARGVVRRACTHVTGGGA